MPSPLDLVGGLQIPGSVHAIGDFMLGGNTGMMNVPTGDLALNPDLATIGRDPSTQEPLVIKSGTILHFAGAGSAQPQVDICGSGEIPAGVSKKNYVKGSLYNQRAGSSDTAAAPIQDYYIKYPFVAATNGALEDFPNGRWLKSGASGVFVPWVSASDSPELAVGKLEWIDTRVDPQGWLRFVTDSMGWPVEAMFPNNILKASTNDGNATVAQTSTTATLSRTIDGSSIVMGLSPASSLRANSTNTIYYFTNDNVSFRHPVHIIVGGVTLDKADVSGVYGSGDGYNYQVNPRDGYVRFSSAQATTATVQATYYYELDYLGGLDWESGIQNLTDGPVSGQGPGWRAFHDVAGATGIMVIRLF